MKSIVYFLENLRYHIFWIIDFFNQKKIYNHVKEISFLTNKFTSPKAVELRERKLNDILNHAITTVPYYKNEKQNKSLDDFKVINKITVIDNFSEFQSEAYVNKKNKTVQTSGSTGLRFKVIQNKNKTIRNTADTIFFSEIANLKIGHKIIYLRLWDKYMRKNSLVRFFQNIRPENILNLNQDHILKLVNELENDKSRKNLLAYASGLEQICLCLDKIKYQPVNLNIKSTIAISESLNEYTRKSIQKYFSCPVVSRYSNTENGILAQQGIDKNSHFHINWASYHIEILNFHNDFAVKNNEMGRIVVTDLFNYAMPLIRYDTGDIGSINYEITPPVLTKIEGRKGDLIFNTNGEIVTKFVTVCFIPYENIIQGQIIQENMNSYTLKLNVNKNFNEEEKLLKEFRNYLGANSIINIDYVNEIPVLSSGKRRLTINKFIK